MEEIECPHDGCDGVFDTFKGVAMHQNVVHEETVPPVGKERLERLYHDKRKSTYEIGDRVGCAGSTVCDWLQYYDIEIRDNIEATRVKLPRYHTDARGYEVWWHQHKGERAQIEGHRLLAIAEGADPFDVFSGDYHVHHKNNIAWDNRPENVKVMTVGEHRSLHAKERAHNPDHPFGRQAGARR